MINIRKVAVVGCGFVGSTIAYTLMESGLFSEIVMIDSDMDRAEGEAMDISHGIPFVQHVKVKAGSYDEISDASMVIITAGSAQKPGETRLDLVKKNVEIYKSIIPQIAATSFDGIMLIVSNPVDILTYVAQKLSGYPANRVVGSGTVLDTARLKHRLSEHLDVDSRSIHAFIIGEHGDSEIAVWSSANVSGIPLDDFCELRGYYNHKASTKEIAEKVKNSAYEIIEKKHATYYGVAMAVKRICEAIVRDEKSILPVSALINNQNGIDGVVLSMPCIVGRNGIETVVPISLNEEEEAVLVESAAVLKNVMASVEILSH